MTARTINDDPRTVRCHDCGEWWEWNKDSMHKLFSDDCCKRQDTEQLKVKAIGRTKNFPDINV